MNRLYLEEYQEMRPGGEEQKIAFDYANVSQTKKHTHG